MRFLAPVLALALLAPAGLQARPPSKKDVDQTLLGLSSQDLSPVRDAEDRHHDHEQQIEAVEAELAIARLELDAAKSWHDAAKTVEKALEDSQKAAQAKADTEAIEDLAARLARAKQTTEWREARWQAEREHVSLQQARLSLAKAEENRSKEEIELARLTVYNDAIGTDADVEVEIGKSQAKVGRLGAQVGRDRKKAEEAERSYDDAIAKAANLDPSL